MSTVFKMTFLAMYTVGNVQAISGGAISGGRLRGFNIGTSQTISDGVGEIIILANQPRHMMRTDHVRNVLEEEQNARKFFQEAQQDFNQAKREEQAAKQAYFQDNAVFSGIPSNVAASNIVRVQKQLKRLRSMAPTSEHLKIKNDLESLLSLSKNSRHDDINNLGEWISSLEFKINNINN